MGARRKHDSGMLVIAIVAVLSTIGAIAAGVANGDNSARVARFDADPGCRAPLNRAVPFTPPSMCSNDDATVVAQYVYSQHNSRYYRLALRQSDGAAHSIETERRPAQALGALAPVGTLVRVQRFTR